MRFPRYPLKTYIDCLCEEDNVSKVLSSHDFQNAILFASPSLYEELQRLLRGEMSDPKDINKLKLGLIKYIARMSSRCTPFALMASCACLKLSDGMNLIIDRNNYVEKFRLDMMCSCIISSKLMNDINVRTHLSYRANNTIYQLGNIIRYIYTSFSNQGYAFQIRELDRNPMIKYLLRKTNRFISFSELSHNLEIHYNINRSQANELIHSLIDHQILLSDIGPMIVGEDAMMNILQAKCYLNKEYISSIDQILKLNSQFSSHNPPEDNHQILRQIQQVLTSLDTKVNLKYIIQLDQFYTSDSGIDYHIVNQIKQGMNFLCRTVPRFENANLEKFKQRFISRYDSQEIPLLEALDPDVGIGYIFTQDQVGNPLIDGLKLPAISHKPKSSYISDIHQLLLNKLIQSGIDNHCIELTDDDVSHLQLNYTDLPSTMAAMFEILDKTKDGEYILGNLRFLGKSAANLIGRFAYGDSAIRNLVEEIVNHEKLSSKEKIIAEIVHLPQPRSGNVLFRPHLRDYEILYLSNSFKDEKQLIPVNELYISVSNNRIKLRAKNIKQEILPRLTTAHNFSGYVSSPVYRFLCDLQSQNERSNLLFSWGVLSDLKHLPRVKYKNIILSYERWIVEKKDLQFSYKTITSENIDNWVSANGLPRYVKLVSGDNKLLIDTQSPLSIAMMLSELSNKEKFILEEFIPSKGILKDELGNEYQNEFIIPLYKTIL